MKNKSYKDIINEKFPKIKEKAIALLTPTGLKDICLPAEEEIIKVLTFEDREGKEIFWHSSAHLLAQAVKELYPESKLVIGPSINEGFFYDFHREEPFKEEDLRSIESKMKELAKKKEEIRRREISIDEAKKIYSGNQFKEEILIGLEKEGENKVSVYLQGGFSDLCRGPHLENTSLIKAIKLTKLSGAYWKGDSSREQLQRIYGITFPDKDMLKEFIKRKEEAEKRDHRKLGRKLGLFSFHEEAPGMPFFHDGGAFIWGQLVDFTASLMLKRDYEINKTPLILNRSLWLQSGHWDHYKENMYFTRIDEQDYAIKPMNCPGNILIYKTKMHSYRELPIKAGEFGLVHRHELSGVLSGLFRVRAFTQDDAHIFCMEGQIEDQIEELLGLIDEVYSAFGFEYHMELSTRPEKAMGSTELWDDAESRLRSALDMSGKDYKINEGDGAFYGPKIDFHLKDAIGRRWQCGTIQLDFQMPEKFDLTYEGPDGKKHRPVMIHRTILGSVERFMGILIEHFEGKLPLWINPSQVIILPIADRHTEYAEDVKDKLKAVGIRVKIDKRVESIGKKIREAQLQKYNLMIVIGDKEVKDNNLSIRTRNNKVKDGYLLKDAKEKILSSISSRSLDLEL